MIKAILSDFARVILFPKDKSYHGRLDELQAELNKKSESHNFFDYFELNQELLDYFKSLKEKVSVNIFTSADTYKIPEVHQLLTPVFDSFFYSVELGVKKTDPVTYQMLAQKLNVKPEEVVFIDDEDKNIEAARQAGLKTVLYKDNQSLLAQLATV